MKYDREIYKVLVEAGETGIPLQKLSRHVYNACNSLFYPVELSEVHNYIISFVQRNSGSPASPIERMSQRGVYRLNPNANSTSELKLQFARYEANAEEPLLEIKDGSLMLPFE